VLVIRRQLHDVASARSRYPKSASRDSAQPGHQEPAEGERGKTLPLHGQGQQHQGRDGERPAGAPEEAELQHVHGHRLAMVEADEDAKWLVDIAAFHD
jgi:hypothetical protein